MVHSPRWTGFEVFRADEHGAFEANGWDDANRREMSPISWRVGGHLSMRSIEIVRIFRSE
jgi:hypothetical protein